MIVFEPFRSNRVDGGYAKIKYSHVRRKSWILIPRNRRIPANNRDFRLYEVGEYAWVSSDGQISRNFWNRDPSHQNFMEDLERARLNDSIHYMEWSPSNRHLCVQFTIPVTLAGSQAIRVFFFY